MININLNKAKIIAHEIRRTKRSEEFSPHDEIIAKQIPGVDAEKAEESRQQIRQKYQEIQGSIDAAKTAEEIKSALGI